MKVLVGRRCFFLLLSALFAFICVKERAVGAEAVETVSGERLEGVVSTITAGGGLELDCSGKKTVIPLEKVFRIQFRESIAPKGVPGGVEVRTVHGSRLYGTLVESKQKTLAISLAAKTEPVQLDAPSVLGVRFAREGAGSQALAPDRFAQECTQPDKRVNDKLFVITENGIVPLDGVVTRITPEKTFFTWDKRDRSIETAKLAAVVFASARANVEAPTGAATVRLVAGSAFKGGKIVSLGAGGVVFEIPGASVTLPTAVIASIELASENVVYLSEMKPASVKEIPFFNHVWKHRRDETVGGNAITLDGIGYARGIGCHTKTVLSYQLDGEYSKFAAVVGIDDEARPRGSVQFIVEADGKQIYSQKLTGDNKSAPVLLDIAGVKKLTLTADFAEDASVGDHADWADARVMK